MKLLLLCVAVTFLLHPTNPQTCITSQLNNDVLGMIASRSIAAGAGDGASPTVVIVNNFNIVCLSLGSSINTYRTASLVIEYICSGPSCPTGKLIQFDNGALPK